MERPLRFIIENPNDFIQSHLMRGRFHEVEHLEVMKKYYVPGTNILDAGANVGNHTVYFSKYFENSTVYPIEPVAVLYKMLLMNVALNYCHNVNLDYIGYGLCSVNATGHPHIVMGEENMGSTRMYPERHEELNCPILPPIQLVLGDDLLRGIDFDFIKMDIEGMEMDALDGLRTIITKCRPKIFIEVSASNIDQFMNWIKTNNYKIVYEDCHPTLHTNYMILPM
jgi:FkbM family methyltransferase